MIYQEKSPALDPGQANRIDQFPAQRVAATPPVNHKVVRAKGPKANVPPLPLFGKVRDYQSANQVRATGYYPYFRTISSAQDTEVIMEGKRVIMLGSNSYLGLTNHPKIKEAASRPPWRL